MTQFALKRLSNSDLTLLAPQFELRPDVRQKAINLNASVFVEGVYPGLATIAVSRIPVDINLFGPGLATLLNLQRKIVKSPGSKNWRLNGETIHNPIHEPARFQSLQEGDFAIFEFSDGVMPRTMTIILIAQNIAEDKELHAELTKVADSRSMMLLSSELLAQVLATARISSEHPAYQFSSQTEEDFENIAWGGSPLLTRTRTPIKMTSEQLLRARENVRQIGEQGELFINHYLEMIQHKNLIGQFEWSSADNAISLYDFRVTETNGNTVLLDVKATRGEFERPIHISLGELQQMKSGLQRYDLYRVYNMNEREAQLRITHNIGTVAAEILESLSRLPYDVSIDAISISPDKLLFNEVIHITLPEDAEN